MKRILKFSVLLIITFLVSCSDDENNSPKTIEVGHYSFTVPGNYNLIERQGIDSYVGDIVGEGITIGFDYGWYTRSMTNLSEDEFIVLVDTIDGHYRQIVRPINPATPTTRIHIYKVADSINNYFGYNSLTMYAYELNAEQQQKVIDIYNSVDPLD